MPFFKNLRLYLLPRPWSMTLGELESSLERLPFQPCGSFDMKTRGWVAPHDDGCLSFKNLVHALAEEVQIQVDRLGLKEKSS